MVTTNYGHVFTKLTNVIMMPLSQLCTTTHSKHLHGVVRVGTSGQAIKKLAIQVPLYHFNSVCPSIHFNDNSKLQCSKTLWVPRLL